MPHSDHDRFSSNEKLILTYPIPYDPRVFYNKENDSNDDFEESSFREGFLKGDYSVTEQIQLNKMKLLDPSSRNDTPQNEGALEGQKSNRNSKDQMKNVARKSQSFSLIN